MTKYLSLSIVALLFSFSVTTSVNAVWNYTGTGINYTVTGPTTQCSDGIDNADTEDILSDSQDPGCHSDGNAGNPASYVSSDNDETDAAAPTPSGTLTVGNCAISLGGSTCGATVSWVTANLTANPTSITRNTGSPASFTPSPLASGSQGVTLGYGSTVFTLIHNAVTLDQKTGTASCASGSWDGDSCEVGGGQVNGMCGASHWSCLQGTSANQTGSGSGPWTWDCLGSGGGSNDSCFEPASGGDPECSDGIDNDGDGLPDYPKDPECDSALDNSESGAAGPQCSDGIDNADTEDILSDSQDPGCHTDGNASNPSSYDPSDDNETNKRKPIFIEF